jgi:hypothetical protein
LLSPKRSLQKNEEDESCREILNMQIQFYSFFWYIVGPKKPTEFASKGPKFSRGPKLEASTVCYGIITNDILFAALLEKDILFKFLYFISDNSTPHLKKIVHVAQ